MEYALEYSITSKNVGFTICFHSRKRHGTTGRAIVLPVIAQLFVFALDRSVLMIHCLRRKGSQQVAVGWALPIP